MSLEKTHTQSDPAALLRPSEAADLIGVKTRALEAWRYRGFGPRWVKVSPRVVRYRRADLIEWAESLVRTSTGGDNTGRRSAGQPAEHTAEPGTASQEGTG